MICVIRRLALTVSDVCLKLGCFQSSSVYSALEVSHFVCYVNSRLTCILNERLRDDVRLAVTMCSDEPTAEETIEFSTIPSEASVLASFVQKTTID